MTSITPPLKWHGGKQYLARRIVKLMPPHLHYVEPYAGGLAVLLAKPCEGVSEVVNDLNSHLTNFWSVLRDEDHFTRFRRLATATPFSEAAWRESANRYLLADVDPVQRAYHFFVACRQSLAGRMTSFAPLSRTRTRKGMNEQAAAWWNAIEGLDAVHARLRRVAILNRPALEVISTNDGADTLYYLDPPYLHETRSTRHEYGAFEMDAATHERLLETLAEIEGRFMLSGYRSELYDRFAADHGWRREEFELPNNAASGPSKRRMIECVWMNFEPDAD